MRSSVIGRSFAVAVGVILALPAAPLGAQTGVSTKLSGASAGQTITGSIGLRAEASAATGIRRLELSIGDVVVARRRFEEIRSEVSISYRWDSEYRPSSSSLGPNREYVLKVEAVANSGANNSTSMKVRVDNPPGAPTGVAATSDSGRIAVQWDANPEPDIIGYRVERDSGGGSRTVAETSGTSLSDRPGPGTHGYRVTALRSSSTSSDPLASSPSAPASATVAAKPSRGGSSGGAGAGAGGGGRGARSSGRGLAAGGPRLGAVGLPSGVALPPRLGLGETAASRGGSLEGGAYSDTLPYDLEDAELVEAGPGNVAARSPARVIPPDGLRWVAAGLLLIAASGLLRVLAQRLDPALAGGSDEVHA